MKTKANRGQMVEGESDHGEEAEIKRPSDVVPPQRHETPGHGLMRTEPPMKVANQN